MIALIAAATLLAAPPPEPPKADPRAYRRDHKACQMHTIDRNDFRPGPATQVAGAAFGAVGGALVGAADTGDKTARWNARIEACMEAKGYPAEAAK